MELYHRQERLNLDIPSVASVVGVGGTGFWVAIFLAMSGTEHLILVDPDVLEESNRNRLPVESRLGLRKVTLCANFINRIRTCRIEQHQIKIESPEDCEILRGTVFCCTDSLKSQQLIYAYCKKNHLQYFRCGYDGTYLNVSNAFPLTFEEEPERTGYQFVPSWVVPCVIAAAASVFSACKAKLTWMCDIAELSPKSDPKLVPIGLREKIFYQKANAENWNCCDDCDRIDPDDPGEWGYCPECNYISPDDPDYGYCPDCDFIDPRNPGNWGYCPDCDFINPDDPGLDLFFVALSSS